MKSPNISLISLFAILIFTVQVVWAASPGGGVEGERKIGGMKDRQEQRGIAKESPVSEMEMVAVEEALLENQNEEQLTAVNAKKGQEKGLGKPAEPAIQHSSKAKLSARQRREEKRAALKKLRKLAKSHHKTIKAAAAPTAPSAGGSVGLFIILAIFIPPLSVLLWMGDATPEFWFNLLLTLFFWIPGVIHAIVVILR